jgi:hypothetical protein
VTGRVPQPDSRLAGDACESRRGSGEEIPDRWDHAEMRWLTGGTKAFAVAVKHATCVGFAVPAR